MVRGGAEQKAEELRTTTQRVLAPEGHGHGEPGDFSP